ncbi:MAG: proline--tRNA ligase, partial [Phycisphaerae bacterium]|nr:proline--tRNA ligase [Phycisphaerae bacterium]
MRWSQLLIPTVKESPAEAEIPSHKLMIRAGLIRKIASGTYAYLHLGQRTVRKITAIVRQEMDNAGAQEVSMPFVQPMELWEKTGRDVDYGETLGKFQDRHGRWNVLQPTSEEVATFLGGSEIKSYKQLPINIYQINQKYRDEFRPRFGVLRSREFTMKDAYSFDATPESLETSYRAMYDAYCRIFERCGIEYVIVLAESGEMGGSGSHQFTVPCETGEDVIVYTEDRQFAANIEKAPVDAVEKQVGGGDIPLVEEVSTPNVGTIDAVCEFLKARPEQLIKTLIYKVGDKTILALVRGDHELNPEKLTQTFDGEHVELADEKTIVEVTGAKVGFAGPVGLSGLTLVIDHAVAAMAAGITGANKTDTHIKNVVPGRDFPLDGEHVIVTDIRNAVEGDTWEGKKLLFKRGIEVGQVFKLGAKYTTKLGTTFLDENGKAQIPLMGCYGIGINRIMASAIECDYDKDGIIWPVSIAPFEVLITVANQNDPEVAEVAENIYQQLKEKHVDVLIDDRKVRGGEKFKDADLIGIPVRMTVGKKGIAEGTVEV